MPTWVMWLLAVVLLVLPFVLAVAFNSDDRADSRGRRISRRWHH
jgi:hypothetical protein